MNALSPPVVVPSGRQVLAAPGVARFIIGASISSIALFLQAAALGKHLFDITDSELALGILGLVEFGPALLLMPLAGAAADRIDRRRLALVGLGVETVTAIFYAWYASSGRTSPLPIFLVAGIFGTARAFSSPAVRSIPPLVAPEHGLPRLVAVYAVTWQIGLIAGPAASGFLYDVDAALPYVVASVGFSVGALLIGFLPLARPQDRSSAEAQPTFHHALEGFRFIRSQPILLGAISLDLFAVLFGGAVALLPAIAEDRLGLGNVGYGWLRAAPGIGAVAVAGMLAARPFQRHVGRVLLGVVGIFGLATIVFGLTTSPVVAFVALMVLAGADATSVFIRTTIVPLATPDRMRGRVSAVENVFVGASNEVGAFESGVAATFVGVGPAVVLGGALTLAVVAIWWTAFPALRNVDRFSEIDVDQRVVASTS